MSGQEPNKTISQLIERIKGINLNVFRLSEPLKMFFFEVKFSLPSPAMSETKLGVLEEIQ